MHTISDNPDMKALLLIPFLFIPLTAFSIGPYIYVEYEVTPYKITGLVENRHKRLMTCKGNIIGISAMGKDQDFVLKSLAKGYRFARGEKRKFFMNARTHFTNNSFKGVTHDLQCKFR